MTDKKLQYRMADGSWEDCETESKTEMFLARCETVNGMTRDEVLEALNTGVVDCGTNWYSRCRYAPAPTPSATLIKEFIPDNEEYGY